MKYAQNRAQHQTDQKFAPEPITEALEQDLTRSATDAEPQPVQFIWKLSRPSISTKSAAGPQIIAWRES
jgi:hypothetical protein